MINELIQRAKKEEICIEVFEKTERENEISVLNDTLEKFNSSYITHYKIKAMYHGKNIMIETDHICIDDIIKNIKEMIEITDNDNQDILAKDSIYSESIEDIKLDYNQITKDLLSLNSLKEKYPEISSMSFFFGHYYEILKITNESNELQDSNYHNYFYTEIVAKDNNEIQTNFFNIVSKEYNFDDFRNKVIEKIEETINSIHCVSCKTDKYNIILQNNCVYKILNTFSSMFSANTINKKSSVLTDKFNKHVFSPKITIVEDPTNDLLVGKRLFDDEGVKTKYKEIVKDGKFITKLYDNQTALKENKKSTGNSYGVRNLYIMPGIKTEKELIEILDEGIVITDIQGLHAGINIINGHISIQASGYYIKDKKYIKSLNMIILSTNLFELFSNVKEVGNNLEYFSKSGGAPSLLIENITIVGKE